MRKEDEKMSEVKKRVCSFVLGVITTFFEMYGMILCLVCMAIVFDTITGTVASKATGKPITSKKANQGFWKKVAFILSLFFGIFIDFFIPISLGFLNIDLPFNMPFGLIFGCYIVFNESISICENLDKIYPKMLPQWVKTMLKGGVDKIDSVIEEEKK